MGYVWCEICVGYVWCEICLGYVWREICVGYVWCEIRQQSSEEPCDETSFGKKWRGGGLDQGQVLGDKRREQVPGSVTQS